ncbi:MAG: hypothetical protein AB7N80_14615 [Bdellovibrionales bacterium]
MGADFFQVGCFQIENLLINRMQFFVFDLRQRSEVPPQINSSLEQKAFWSKAKAINPDQAVTAAKELVQSLEAPLMLLCEDGEISSQVAARLVREGYSHLLVVDGGIKQLIRDWEQSIDS